MGRYLAITGPMLPASDQYSPGTGKYVYSDFMISKLLNEAGYFKWVYKVVPELWSKHSIIYSFEY